MSIDGSRQYNKTNNWQRKRKGKPMAKVHREMRARQQRLKQAENRVALIFQSKVSM